MFLNSREAQFFIHMEQAQLLMWTKRRHNLIPHQLNLGSSPTYDDSWEEQAFARDASGSLGGCVWPPRSYSCSFCKREFRSAQALGGHMNVHRRDRARLKQSGSETLNSHEHPDQPIHIQGPFVPISFPYISQAFPSSALPHSPNPNPSQSPFMSPTSSSRVSAPSCEDSSNERTPLNPSHSSSLLNENRNKSQPRTWPDAVGNRYQHIVNPIIGEKNLQVTKQQLGEDNHETRAGADLSVCLNLVIRSRPNSSDDIAESHSCKRRKIDESSSILPFLVKSITVERNHNRKEACAPFNSGTGDDLDLELRLGDRPKVKLQS
ncbi:hypothetical protein SAY87_014827 [Trapa incisa]|uniref:C2H2-type domain-containing protein n=1 Tax=Trapa incisa TaxID=236973 RepID=A0AAN7GKM9_9MYRT|nr:hypothetical protein SAY87_014827 [Trapa incisa]